MTEQQTMRGVFAVPTTPYDADGAQNLEALLAGVETSIEAGVTGFLVLGATGEALALSDEERDAQIAAVVEAVAGRAHVVVGCMGYTPERMIDLITRAEELGADTAMITPPYYGGLEADTATTALHAVMSASKLPVMVYNNPHSTGTDLTPEHLATLLDTGSFWSVKETSGEATRVRELRDALGTDVEVFVGADGIALEGFIQGASGWVAASAWLLPGSCQRLWELSRDGHWADAVDLWNRLGGPLALIEGNSAFISLIKQSVSRLRTEQGPVRPPLPTASNEVVEALLASIDKLERN